MSGGIGEDRSVVCAVPRYEAHNHHVAPTEGGPALFCNHAQLVTSANHDLKRPQHLRPYQVS